LEKADKKRLTEIQMEASQHSPKYSATTFLACHQQVGNCTSPDPRMWMVFPEKLFEAAAFLAKTEGKESGDGCFIGSLPSLHPVRTYCKKPRDQKADQQAYSSRASVNEYDNQEIIIKDPETRAEKAVLLGYKKPCRLRFDRSAWQALIETASEFLERIYAIAYPVAQKGSGRGESPGQKPSIIG
jgi:Zn-dependent oligopeptidase